MKHKRIALNRRDTGRVALENCMSMEMEERRRGTVCAMLQKGLGEGRERGEQAAVLSCLLSVSTAHARNAYGEYKDAKENRGGWEMSKCIANAKREIGEKVFHVQVFFLSKPPV